MRLRPDRILGKRARRALLVALLFAVLHMPASSSSPAHTTLQDGASGERNFVNLALPASGEVRVENQRGGVKLEVWGEEYLAVAILSGGALIPSDSKSPLRLERAESLLTITVPRVAARPKTSRRATRRAVAARPSSSLNSSAINLVVRVPAAARVQIITSGGAVEARGTPARLEVQTVAGDITLSVPPSADADVMARTLDGAIKVGAGLGAGAGQTVRERFAARLGKGARLVRLSTVRGRIELAADGEELQGRSAAAGSPGVVASAPPRAGASEPLRQIVPPALRPREGTPPQRIDDAPAPRLDVQPREASRRPPVLVGANDAGARQSPQVNAKPTPPPGAPVEVDEDEVLTVDTSVVTLNFSVVDRKSGRGVVGLSGADFKIFEDGREQQITHFEAANAPFDLLLLIDLSGSTARVTDLIRASAQRFVDAVRPNDRVGVVAFAAATQVVSPLTSDKESLRSRLRGMGAPQGDTKLYDAANFALEYLSANSPKQRRRAVVLLSDGLDSALPNVQGEGSALSYQELRRRVEEFDGLFYTIQPDNYEEPQSPLDVQPGTYDLAGDRMEELATTAGGLFYDVGKLEDLADIYGRVVEDLGTVYSLSYLPTNKARDGSFRAVRVRLPRRPEAIARGRSGYYAK